MYNAEALNISYFFFPSILFNSLSVSIYAFSADLIVWSICFPIVSATSYFKSLIVHRKALSDIFIQPFCCPLTELSCNLGFYSVTKRNNHIEVVIFCLIRLSSAAVVRKFRTTEASSSSSSSKICFICSLTFALLEPYKSTS